MKTLNHPFLTSRLYSQKTELLQKI
jgi:hypothetical protein